MTIPRQSEALTVSGQSREIIVPDEYRQPISAVTFVNVLLRHRTLIVLTTLIFGFWAGLNSVTSPKGYSAYAAFMPRGARGAGQLGGLAAQFGINLSGGDAMSSPQLYTDLMEMRTILLPVAQKTYRIRRADSVVEGNIEKIYNIKGRPAVREARAVLSLRGAVKSAVNAKTGVINLTVKTGNADLSYQIAKNVLDQLNVYNMTNRQAAAAAEREFVELQVGEKAAELRVAEDRLASFLESNRQYRTSPQLTLEYARLERDVARKNQVYGQLSAAFQTARIEEIRNLPVINVLEAPELPIGPDPRGGVRRTLTGMFLGFVLACLFSYVRDRFAHHRATGSDEVLEYAALKREAIGDLTHPWRPLTRAIGSRRRA